MKQEKLKTHGVRRTCSKCGRRNVEHRTFFRKSGRLSVYSSCRKCETSATTRRVSHDPFRIERGVWRKIKERCFNPNARQFERYSPKGVCPAWARSFAAFLKDMGKRPGDSFSIDRIDNRLGYSPENCRWATRRTQSRNRSTNVWITFRGQKMVAADWASEIGMRPGTLLARLERGWPIRMALTTPVRHQRSRARR